MTAGADKFPSRGGYAPGFFLPGGMACPPRAVSLRPLRSFAPFASPQDLRPSAPPREIALFVPTTALPGGSRGGNALPPLRFLRPPKLSAPLRLCESKFIHPWAKTVAALAFLGALASPQKTPRLRASARDRSFVPTSALPDGPLGRSPSRPGPVLCALCVPPQSSAPSVSPRLRGTQRSFSPASLPPADIANRAGAAIIANANHRLD